MKIVSWNVNGLRSVSRKGFLEWVKKENADVICLQEIKIQDDKITPDLLPNNYHHIFNFAQKPGYSGVAIFTKEKPLRKELKLGQKRFDNEGRIIRLSFPDFDLFNLYLPHGGRGKENIGYKLDTYRHLLNKLQNRKRTLLIGDFNIAHTEIDLARPKGNKNNTMFTPEERLQLDKLNKLGFIDTFRSFNKDGGNYTWWPYFANARERNLGWRIDYCFVSKDLRPKLKNAFILNKATGSDHCPIGIELNY